LTPLIIFGIVPTLSTKSLNPDKPLHTDTFISFNNLIPSTRHTVPVEVDEPFRTKTAVCICIVNEPPEANGYSEACLVGHLQTRKALALSGEGVNLAVLWTFEAGRLNVIDVDLNVNELAVLGLAPFALAHGSRGVSGWSDGHCSVLET